ncbi:hypothetical protein FRB95_005573 [Tulasnella sp. JGI-2019a]|nr:hypothetical protein FRB95_005573 [Tulasnella sp. JGI-2019a]
MSAEKEVLIDHNAKPRLTALLQELNSSSGLKLSPSTASTQLSPLLDAFLLTSSQHARSLAFLVLSRIVSNARPKDPAAASEKAQTDATANLSQLFTPLLEPRLSSTNSKDVIPALGLCAAVFQVDQAAASQILLKDGVMEAIMDSTDLFHGDEGREVARCVAALLSQASGSKSCRPLVVSHAMTWLQSQSQQTLDSTLRAAAAISLTKLSKGTGEDSSSAASLSSPAEHVHEGKPSSDGLVSLMRDLVLDSAASAHSDSSQGSTPQATLDAVEGLAYLTSDPNIREVLSADSTFLARLFALVPPPRKRQTGQVPVIDANSTDLNSPQQRSSLGLLYGVAVIIANITAYKPQLSEEEKQVEKLRNMTQAGAQMGQKLSETQDPMEIQRESPLAVKRRCRRLVKAGVLPVLVSIASRFESESVRRTVGQAFLSLVEDKENRGKVIQAGGAKSLLSIIRAALAAIEAHPKAPKAAKGKFDSTLHQPARALDAKDLPSIQALAKLSITASPLLLFGPDASSSIDAIHPLGHLLLNPSSNLLQRFEALMSLTNLGSLGPMVASRIATYIEAGLGSILTKAETLLLDDNTLVRRAAMELTCNLISSDEVWERYTGEGPDGKTRPDSETPMKTLVNRLHIVLALSDVDDVGTRLAASGALAMLTGSGTVCRIIIEEMEDGPKKAFAILTDLISPTSHDDHENSTGADDTNIAVLPPIDLQPQLVHRGVVCTRNILTNLESTPIRTDTVAKVVKAAEATNLVEALLAALKSPSNAGNKEIVMASAQALKWLADHGIQLPVV